MRRPALFVVLLALAACSSPTRPSQPSAPAPCTAPAPTVPLIEYRLVGDGPVDVTYEDEFGHWVDEVAVTPPWTYRHTKIWGGAWIHVMQRGTGCVTAQVWRHGVLEDQGRVCGRWQALVLSKGWW